MLSKVKMLDQHLQHVVTCKTSEYRQVMQ